MKNLPTLTGLFTLSLALLNAQETQNIQQESNKQDEKVLLETAVVSAPIMRFSLDELNRNMVIIDHGNGLGEYGRSRSSLNAKTKRSHE